MMQVDAEPFLNVAKSISGRRWLDRLDPVKARMAGAITQQTGLSEILSRVIAGRGVAVEDAEAFLTPTLRDLMPDPSSIAGMDGVATRLADAISRNEKIAFFGDYDVDGACSTALMLRYFAALGQDPVWHVPDRIFEGYGPNTAAIDGFIASGATLIVTLDCGTTSFDTIAHARAKGVDVLVIDHHQVAGELPPANGIVNPNRPDDISGLGYLCAAGVVFMVLVAVNRLLRARGQAVTPDLMQLLDLVALATVCDVVPLTGLNRALVARGIDVIRAGGNVGLTSLAIAGRVAGPVNTYHLGFVLGPRINAGGRIGDAGLGTRLLSSTDEHEAITIAATLDELNAERQRIEAEALEQAVAVAEAEIGQGEGPAVLVTASRDWHQGVVGLIAARLKERFGRPAFAIALGPDGGGTGSGRSVPRVDLGAAVIKAVSNKLLAKGGGHAMAAGITLGAGQLGPFRAFLEAELGDAVAAARSNHSVRIDAAMTARAASSAFYHEIERAGPFGAGNATPVFAFPSHQVRYAEIVGAGGHVRLTLASGDGATIKAIAFRAADTPLGTALLKARDGARLHVCGTLSLNHWQGRESVQLRIIDAAMPG